MPFVQRVVQPVNVAQVSAASVTPNKAATRFQCIPGKCKNNNCINKQQQQQQQQQNEHTNNELGSRTGNEVVKDTTTTNQTTQALVHSPQRHLNGFNVDHAHNQSNGYAGNSFSYATDNEDNETTSSSVVVVAASSTAATGGSLLSVTACTAPVLGTMKKLKQHVEFLSTSPSHLRSNITASQSLPNSRQPSQQRQPTHGHQQQQQQALQRAVVSAPQSPTAGRIISGYEFDSISNITLSNALRQLASLVLIASDIFDELQQELQSVGERAGRVQRKITAVERRVCAYDPKTVTVPESDLLTFAQRKVHFETEKSFQTQLFTAESRPHSVRQLYEDAAKVSPPPTHIGSRARSPASPASATELVLNEDGLLVLDATSTGSDELVCTPVFGKANRKMRTRIDAEIEIRLPAAIDDLRKWTSSEALGDVTVTPDCMHHVDTSISTSIVIGDNGVLTPALSPSVLSADAVDALYAINVSSAAVDSTQLPNDINKDVPLNHRLPSPEEQTKIIALKYPAEVISVDTSGKRFQRMCAARKSTTGCYLSPSQASGSSATATATGGATNGGDANNLSEDVQTVSRRSRSRKVRGKRRNTIAGIDQKEIQDAANGDSTNGGEIKNTSTNAGAGAGGGDAGGSGAGANVTCGDAEGKREKSKKFGRSKSSDILKKETVALPYDKGKNTLTRLNSLKQWGRNRFKFMQRNELIVGDAVGSHDTSTSGCSSHNTSTEKADASNSSVSGVSANSKKSAFSKGAPVTTAGGGSGSGSGDIDDECVVHALIQQKSEGRFSHERKPSYSSSEKSMSVSSSGHLRGKLQVVATATCGNVKMRDTASLNRQRRNGISTTNGLAGKEEQPHSSSGNWSASSESGRASIGSEITIQPKSSASNTSLNVSSFHPGSGPPSSMMSRRRFLNTSASSSVTSEGTATPDLQVADGSYPNHLDDETSSAYSCDTEGYYTSFHMDSGLRTLKEEEPPMTPLQQSQNLHTSNYSFGSQSNQTVLNAENEYELFGRGSTSTTTSSAGTVCTTLMNGHGPDVPERISSLGKLNKGCHSNSASSSTLERSYSSSTIGSTLERTGTIKRNVNAGLKLTPATSESNTAEDASTQHTTTPESHEEEEFNYEQRLRKRTALPLPPNMTAEVECSESSDLEGVERIERIKQKTAINVKRIPSMCIITPTTSDDENQATKGKEAYDPNRTLTNNESSPSTKAAATLKKQQSPDVDATTYCTVDVECANKTLVEEAPLTPTNKDHNLNVLKAAPETPTKSLFGKLKVVLPHIKRSPSKSSPPKPASASVVDNDDLYDTAGEYVTIADISNNNRNNQLPQVPKPVGASGLGIYYSNDIVRRRRLDSSRKADELMYEGTKENQPPRDEERSVREAEYVSLNELPQHLRRHANVTGGSGGGNVDDVGVKTTKPATSAATDSLEANACAETQPERQLQQTATKRSVKSSSVPMYAEISELREEKSLISASAQQRGARVLRPNAEGRIVYDSDSLKRRKGAHTTFAPGPYVKETESALNDIASANIVVSLDSAADGSSGANASESATNPTTVTTTTTTKSAGAKLLLLNGGIVANRKIANVRPIVSKSPLTRQNIEKSNTTNMPAYMDQARGQFGGHSYQEHKNLLANHTNPFYQPNAANAPPAAAPAATTTMPMMHSPSTKSNSSTGSTATNSSSSTSTTASAASAEEGYQHFSNIYEQVEQKPQSAATAMDSNTMPFQRSAPIYWTLQSRRQSKPAPNSVTVCRDDLYATPIRRSDRVARAASVAASGSGSGSVSSASTTQSNISPIVPRNRSAFLTSTPTRSGDNSTLPADNIPSKQPSSIRNWEENNSPERLNTCADRIGHSKTSLMDFKKLLLAKSAKTNPVQRKLSAVEMLKKANSQSDAGVGGGSTNGARGVVTPGKPAPNSQNGSSVNSSLKLLDLSGSPKTFANRRMLRQGQFGSPSKSFAPKLRANTAAVQRTDVMSTTIPEANSSEEDHSNTSGSNSSRASSVVSVEPTQARTSIAETSYDLKRNFFLQTEENNFMRGELRKSFTKSGTGQTPQVAVAAANQCGTGGGEINAAAGQTVVRAAAAAMTALETAL